MNTNETYKRYFDYRRVNLPNRRESVLPEYLRQVLTEVDRSARILDVGCGYGHIMFALENEGFNDVSGVDVSEQAVEYCKSQGLDVQHVDVMAWKPAEKYDFIVMSHVLEHLPKDDIVPILSKIRQDILSVQGKLCLMVPNAQSNTGCYWAYEDFTHNTLFTGGSLLFVLRMAGFDNVEFLDIDGLSHLDKNSFEYHKRKLLLELYITNKLFWNKITGSSYHRSSPLIFSFEIKALASPYAYNDLSKV